MCPSTLSDGRRVGRSAGFYTQPERCGILFVTEEIIVPALLLVLTFRTFLQEKFSTVFKVVLEGLLVLMNSYFGMKWIYCV